MVQELSLGRFSQLDDLADLGLAVVGLLLVCCVGISIDGIICGGFAVCLLCWD